MLGIFLEHKADTPEDKRQKATLRTNSVIAIADTLPYINLPLQQQQKKPKTMDWFYGAEIYSNRVNRSNWNDKSQAAVRREEEAINLFNDTFMKMANQATEFPFTMDGLIPPTTHLTDACWKTFKQIITAKGCKAKRRVITPAERIALKGKNTRSGKMYSISVTAPSHPSQVLAALEAKRVKAAAAKERKEQDAKKRQQDEADMKALVLQDYAKVVELVASVGKGIDVGVDSKKRPLEESESEIKKSGSEENNPQGGNGDDADTCADTNHSNSTSTSPTKKSKLSANFVLAAPKGRIFNHADAMHSAKIRDIRTEIQSEKYREKLRLMKDLDARMKSKEDAQIKEATAYCDFLKKTVELEGIVGTHSNSNDDTSEQAKPEVHLAQ